MTDDPVEDSQGIGNATRRTGKIHDQRRTPSSGNSPRQRCPRKLCKTQCAQILGDPLSLALDYRTRRLGRDVPRRKAGATGGQHEVHLTAVAQPGKQRNDSSRLVGYLLASGNRIAA